MKYPITLTIVLFSLILVTSSSIAQTTSDPWTTPVNLSNSGSTIDPVMVIDSEDRVHVLWQDTYAGFVYSWLEEGQWSQPEMVNFPFGANRNELFTPTLVADANGYLYAFWIDNRSELFYSRVFARDFGNPRAWESPKRLTRGTSKFDVAITDENFIHLVYVQTQAFLRQDDINNYPAGIYYLQSGDGGRNWSAETSMYLSPYMRGMSGDDLSLTITGSKIEDVHNVYIGWDNRPLKRIFLRSSTDGGLNWDSIEELDSPDTNPDSPYPFDIIASADGDNIHVLWQKGDEQSGCTHFYRWSEDGGESWSDNLSMLGELTGCSQNQQFIIYTEDMTILQKTFDNQVYFLAWQGDSWSKPQRQDSLSSFVDPDNLIFVEYGCHKFGYQPINEIIIVVGCDVSGVGDTWFMNRNVGNIDDLYPSPSIWNPPVTVATNFSELQSPILVADSHGVNHLFWIQEEDAGEDSGNRSIYYSRWDGDKWSNPIAPHEALDDDVSVFSASVGENDIIYLVWNNHQAGENLISWASAENANTGGEWAPVQSLPNSQIVTYNPYIFADSAGVIYVASVKPVNEERGVYLNQSSDLGQSWSEEIQVFDAKSSDWEMVDNPRLAGTANGHKHMIWTRYSIPGGNGPLALYYSRSEDNGLTWSEPIMITESSVIWSRVLGFGDSTVHLIWQEVSSGRSVIQHLVSENNGQTWGTAATISNFNAPVGSPGVSLDPAGRLHLVLLVQENNNLVLKHWFWDGERWITSESAELGESDDESFHGLSVAFSNNSNLSVVYSDINQDELSAELVNVLNNTSRSVELPTILPTTEPIRTPTPTITQVPEPTPTLTPSITPYILPTVEQGGSSSTPSMSNSVFVVVFGGVVIVLIAAVIVGVRLSRRRY